MFPSWMVTFASDIFSLTEAPLPDPTQHLETDPKRTRNGAKRSQTDPNRAEMDRNQALSGGTAGGFVGRGGGGVVKEKENH